MKKKSISLLFTLLACRESKVIGIDQDLMAIDRATSLQNEFPERFAAVCGRFGDVKSLIRPILQAWHVE